jgi:hypothetical protein
VTGAGALALLALTATIVVLSAGSGAEARSNGITGRSGNPATGGTTCTACHSGGIAPAVTIAGPALVAPSAVYTYTLTIAGGQEVAGGLDVSTTTGALAVQQPGTILADGEITHSTPRLVNDDLDVVFAFYWVAPAAPGSATLYGAGNSVNLNGFSSGDLSSTDQHAITVATNAPTPGEAAGVSTNPLRITARNPTTGVMSLSYGRACGSTNNNVYVLPLGQVSSFAWASAACNIGNTGTLAGFNPGPDSYAFLVAGNRGSDEGSYGRSRLPGGSTPERPPYAGNACGDVQTLANTCD